MKIRATFGPTRVASQQMHKRRVNVDNLNYARGIERESEKRPEQFGFHVNHRAEESKSVMIFPYGRSYRDFNISHFLV